MDGVSSRRPGFDLGSLCMGFIVNVVALGNVPLPVLRVCSQYHFTNTIYSSLFPCASYQRQKREKCKDLQIQRSVLKIRLTLQKDNYVSFVASK